MSSPEIVITGKDNVGRKDDKDRNNDSSQRNIYDPSWMEKTTASGTTNVPDTGKSSEGLLKKLIGIQPYIMNTDHSIEPLHYAPKIPV